MSLQVLRRFASGPALAFFLVLIAANANAGASFSVSPVRIALTADQPIASVTVRNSGSRPAVVQISAVHWTQKNGEDVYDATREILATPPIFTILPGARQVVRVGLRRPQEPDREQSFRLFLKEVPSAGFADTGLQVALQLSIPVFVLPAGMQAAPVFKWQATRGKDGKLQISLHNDGNAHIQITDLHLSLDGRSASQQILTYILPQKSRNWTLPFDAPAGSTIRIRAKTNAGKVEAEPSVE